jgi:hypothetical protein
MAEEVLTTEESEIMTDIDKTEVNLRQGLLAIF